MVVLFEHYILHGNNLACRNAWSVHPITRFLQRKEKVAGICSGTGSGILQMPNLSIPALVFPRQILAGDIIIKDNGKSKVK
jgi:hypothetical protein